MDVPNIPENLDIIVRRLRSAKMSDMTISEVLHIKLSIIERIV